jgi:hypothetical protein
MSYGFVTNFNYNTYVPYESNFIPNAELFEPATKFRAFYFLHSTSTRYMFHTFSEFMHISC